MAKLIVNNNSSIDIAWILNEKKPVNILKSNEETVCELVTGEYTIFTRSTKFPTQEEKLNYKNFVLNEDEDILEITICGKNTFLSPIYFEWDWKEHLSASEKEELKLYKNKVQKTKKFEKFLSDKESKNKCSILNLCNKRLLNLQDNIKKGKLFISIEAPSTEKGKQRLCDSELLNPPIIEMNTKKKEWKINNIIYYNYHGWYLPLNDNNKVYKFSDLISYEIIENNKTIFNSITKGGNTKALVGGLLFGSTGAIVGGSTAKRKTQTLSEDYCNSLKIKIVVNDIENETIYIDFINVDTQLESNLYKEKIEAAQEIISLLEFIEYNNTKSEQHKSELSDDEFETLKKYKELLDMEIITKKEFEDKKKEILNGYVNDNDSEELYTCDNCGADVKEEDTECPKCGASFIEDANTEENDSEKLYTCDNCGTAVKEEDTECPKCGGSFVA